MNTGSKKLSDVFLERSAIETSGQADDPRHMKNSKLSDQHIEVNERLAHKARTVWNALQKYHENGVEREEINYLFARYILGLTVPVYGSRLPDEHLRVYKMLMAEVLENNTIELLLHTVPDAAKPRMQIVRRKIESLGQRDGEALQHIQTAV